MSEEILKEKSIDEDAGSAAPFADTRPFESGVSSALSAADAEAENHRKFDGIRARMAESLKEAEDRGRARVAEISLARKEEYSRLSQKKEEPSSDEKPKPEAEMSSAPSAAADGNAEAEDELTIKLGAHPNDYGDKCIIRVGTPMISHCFFTVPYTDGGSQTSAPQSTQPGRQNHQSYAGYTSQPSRLWRESGGLNNEPELDESRFDDEKYPEPRFEDEKYPEPRFEDEKYPEPQPSVYNERETYYEDPYHEYNEESAFGYSDATEESFASRHRAASSEKKRFERDADDVAAEEEYRAVCVEGELQAFEKDKVDVYEVAQLNKAISRFYREENDCARKIQKIEAKQKDSDNERNIALIVEKISLEKEICELAVEMLGACVYVSARGKIVRHEKLLRSHIDKYNRYCEEYEGCTGRALHRLDYGMIEDVLEGRISRPIPNVYYYGAEGEAVYNSSDPELDRIRREEDEYAAVSREYERYIEDGGRIDPTPAERRAFDKQKASRISAIRRATERDVLLVALRNEYRLESLEARRDILVNSYGSDKGRVMKELRTIERSMSKVRAASRRSIPVEREDNTRFYLLSALNPDDEKVRDGASRDRLASLRQRLEVLLSERESINERLIVLYGGSDKKLKKAKITRKAAAVRRKSARRSFKKQGDLARRIERFDVSSDMKEKAYALLNQKTAAVAHADEIRYKITHLNARGRARGELYSEFKRAKREIKRTDSEIRYMMRRLKKIEDRNSDRRELAILFALIAAFALVVGVVWLTSGDAIVGYFKELFAKLRGL